MKLLTSILVTFYTYKSKCNVAYDIKHIYPQSIKKLHSLKIFKFNHIHKPSIVTDPTQYICDVRMPTRHLIDFLRNSEHKG